MAFSAFLKLGILEPQHVAVHFHCTLQSIVEAGRRLGLNLDGDTDLHAGARGELQDDFVNQIGEPRSVLQANGLPQTRQPNCYSGKPTTLNKKALPYDAKRIVGPLRV